MRIVRTILAALVTVSLAIAPVAASAAIVTPPAAAMMADHADMPCCNVPDDCKGSIACAFKCLTFVGAIVSVAAGPASRLDPTRPSFVAGALRPHVSSPPTHPPPG